VKEQHIKECNTQKPKQHFRVLKFKLSGILHLRHAFLQMLPNSWLDFTRQVPTENKLSGNHSSLEKSDNAIVVLLFGTKRKKNFLQNLVNIIEQKFFGWSDISDQVFSIG
jgi:hypothetical protein